MNFFVLMISIMIIGTLTGYCAQKRGRDPMIWFLLGGLFGIFALGALFLLPNQALSTDPQISQDNLDSIDYTNEIKQAEIEQYRLKEWWYLDHEHKQQGPMSFDFLRGKWAEDAIDGSTFVWNDEMKDWKRIRDLPDILSAISGE